MARYSDFRQVAGGRIALDPKLMSHNAFDSGNSVDWEQTKIVRPRGGELGSDPFEDAEREVQRSIATDAKRSRRQRLHDALDRVLDTVGKKRKPAAVVVAGDRSTARDSQRSLGGGCGRSYACDTGWLP
jgi:hypothetical protein